MKRYLTEFIGTFFLVLIIGLAVADASPLAPLVIGAGLTALIYMGGHISGAHYNPAVSLAFLLRGRMNSRELPPYVAAQLAGAVAGAAMVTVTTGTALTIAPAAAATTGSALLIEILFTFVLVLVILNVATSKALEGNSFYGIAIGLVVAAGAFVGGPISGGALNPAVGLGPAVVHLVNGTASIGHVWLYIVGPTVGSVLAVAAFRLQNPEDK